MKDDDALPQGDGEWGGAREKRWDEHGKRAVVMVDADVYATVVVLAGFCRRPVKSLNKQIYAAGLRALFGQDLVTLESTEVSISRPRNKPVAKTDEAVRAIAQEAFTFGERA